MAISFPYGPSEIRHGRLLDTSVYLLSVLMFVWFAASSNYGSLPHDMAAIYYAASFAAEARPDQIYWDNQSIRPLAWLEAVKTDGYPETFYPYVYPPIWAYILAPLANWLEPRAFFNLFTILHAVLFCTTTRMAYHMIAAHTWLSVWAVPVLIIMITTIFGASLIAQCQPSAIMFFLIVWGLKSLVDGRLKRAGILLAIASTIKIFPVLLGVVFLTKRFRQGLRPFIFTGLALVIMSFAFLPFDLHKEFVAIGTEVSSITNLSYLNMNLESFVSRVTLILSGVDQKGLYVMQDNRWITGINVLATFLFAFWLYKAAQYESMFCLRRRIVPLALIGLIFVSPIAWAHYFAVILCFLPALFFLIPGRAAILILVAFTIVNSPAVYQIVSVPVFPMLGTLSMIGVGALFAFAGPKWE